MSEPAKITEPAKVSEARRFWGFALVGGIAAAINWSSRIVFSMLGMPFTAAIVCAYIIGMTTAYVLNRRYVFEASGRTARSEIWRFTLINLIALVQVWGVSEALVLWVLPWLHWTWRPEELAHAAGVASPILTSYLGHRHFTFGKAK